MRLLVVDDDRAVREALALVLDLNGFEVATAEDWREAIRTLAVAPPDAVILDVLMPGLDGLEVCRRMRAIGDRTPVLMLTARTEVSERVAGLEAGADDYLAKPFAREELIARLRALLRRTGGRARTRRCDSMTSSSTPSPTRPAGARGCSSSRAPSSCCSSCSCAPSGDRPATGAGRTRATHRHAVPRRVGAALGAWRHRRDRPRRGGDGGVSDEPGMDRGRAGCVGRRRRGDRADPRGPRRALPGRSRGAACASAGPCAASEPRRSPVISSSFPRACEAGGR
jgi:CheY-like chemotaxis protein